MLGMISYSSFLRSYLRFVKLGLLNILSNILPSLPHVFEIRLTLVSCRLVLIFLNKLK